MTREHTRIVNERVRFKINGRASLARANAGVVIQAGPNRSLVEFPAPRASGAERERVWCWNVDLTERKGNT